MPICRSTNTSLFFAKLVNPLVCLVIILALLYVGQEILKPLAFSTLIALLLISPCRFLERRGMTRGLAAMTSLLTAFLIFMVIFYFISNSIVSFKNDVPLLMQNIDEFIQKLEIWIQKNFDVSTQDVKQIVENSTDKVLPSTSSIVNKTVNTVTDILFLGIMIFITTFLLLLYRGLIVRSFTSFFAKEHTVRIHGIFTKTRSVIKNYIVGLFIEMVVVAAANCTVFFVLGVKYALLLGVIGAVLNIIPYLGITMACILSALITLTTNSSSTVAWVVISLIIIHMLDSNILMPKIVGSKVKINALATIVGIIIGSALWGIPGTFMAVPFIAIMKVIFEDIEAFRPFAMVMGPDDTAEKDMTRPMIKRIRRSLRG